MTTEVEDFTGTMQAEASEVGTLPAEMLKAFDIMADSPEEARALANLHGTGMAQVSKSKVHFGGKRLPEFVYLYSADGTPSKIPTARLGYYMQKGFLAKCPVQRPVGTFLCPRAGCKRGEVGHGMLTPEKLDDHIRTKHRRLWADIERKREREDRTAQATASHELLKELAALLKGTGGQVEVPPEVVEAVEAAVSTEPVIRRPRSGRTVCPDCGKSVKGLAQHKRYCKGG